MRSPKAQGANVKCQIDDPIFFVQPSICRKAIPAVLKKIIVNSAIATGWGSVRCSNLKLRVSMTRLKRLAEKNMALWNQYRLQLDHEISKPEAKAAAIASKYIGILLRKLDLPEQSVSWYGEAFKICKRHGFYDGMAITSEEIVYILATQIRKRQKIENRVESAEWHATHHKSCGFSPFDQYHMQFLFGLCRDLISDPDAEEILMLRVLKLLQVYYEEFAGTRSGHNKGYAVNCGNLIEQFFQKMNRVARADYWRKRTIRHVLYE